MFTCMRSGSAMARPSPREVKAVAAALDAEYDDIDDAARAVITALDEVRATKDQWIVVARPLANGPIVSVGPWTTHNQAAKASTSIVSAHKEPTDGTGMAVVKMYQPDWINKLNT